jgi:hypothetical protein
VRDIEKWKSRDRRTLKRDNICFEEHNPFVTGKMLRGVDTLTRLLDGNPEAKSYNYNRTIIKTPMAERGVKLYNSAIAASLGSMLAAGDYRSKGYDGTEWIDVAGQYLPLGVVEDIIVDIAERGATIETVEARFEAYMSEYNDMAAAYAYGVLSQLMGYMPTDEEVSDIIASAENIRRSMREVTESDRMRDSGFDMMVGYGYDFRDEEEHKADFLNSR